ncbi:tetratricopeptide repeat protein [Spirosoma linguale]|uniref:Tetratricopeptide TPR_2 repeat protein n=1 Tax=Spirosoma linguale (strain ATCC 33905 / DSM 74 / LMG 10896 / Claus 1) TaxID=504472 RepID=D2QG44_SPILD|nr:Tetratricopeptide TPR_2 repeat protein [Spirosoma linguale DSM 74]
MTPAQSNRPTTVWPLADLFDALQRGGFQLRPNDYTDLMQVLDAFQPQSYADLQALVAPLLVTSEEEQGKFDRIFEKIQQKEGIKTQGATKRNSPWKWLVAGFLILLALGYVAFFWPGPAFRTGIHQVNPVGPVEVGDTLVFSVDSSMQKAAGPLARWQWETPDGRPYPNAQAPTLRVPAYQVGPLTVNLRSQHGRGLLLTTWTDSLQGITYPICDKLPVVKLDSFRLSDAPLRYRFRARLVGEVKTVQRMQWQLNGAVVASNRTEWEHTFRAGSAPGYHAVRVEATTDSTRRLCFGDGQLTVGVPGSNEPPFTLDVQAVGTPVVLKTSLNRGLLWASWVAGGLLLLLAVVYIWLMRRKPKSTPPLPSDTNPMARFTSDTPPLEIPLENREAELITLDQSFYRLVRTLRQPVEGEVKRLHIGQTMQATMLEGGFPTLIFQPHLAERNYIFLIDRSQVRSQQVALFEYLFRVFTQENVCVERFFFHKTFALFTNETHKKGLTLQQLADLYRSHTLVIWSTGYPLLYPPYPVVEPAIRDALADWESRAILTPVPFADWSSKERALQTDFLLLPADMPGQLRLMQALAEKQMQQDAYLQQQADLYSLADLDAEDTDELEDYLGEDLFQWLAALAIYPRIRWEFVLEIGWVLMPPETVNFTNLLRLARIGWMNEGHFPDYIRLELLKKLYPENEAKARQRLLQMLAYAEQYFPGEHFYDGEKHLLETANQFALYAYDADTFADYRPAQKAFKELYEQRLYPDGAMLRYLENPNGSWTTLLPATQVPVPGKAIKSAVVQLRTMGLQAYLTTLNEPIVNDLPERTADKREWYLLAGIVVVFLSLIGLIYRITRPQSREIDWNQLVPVTIVLDTTACAPPESNRDLAESGAVQGRWNVYLNNSRYGLRNLQATRSFLLRDLVASTVGAPTDSIPLLATLSVSDTTTGFSRQYSNVSISGDTLRVRINCPKPKVGLSGKLRVSVEYTNPNAPNYAKIRAYMNALEADTTFEFVRPLKPAIFTGRSQVRYFRTADKAAAETLAVQAGKALGIPIGIQLIKDSRTFLTHLEVWINNGVSTTKFTCQPVAGSWFRQFNGWQAKVGDGSTSKINTDGKSIGLEQESVPAKNVGAALSVQSIGVIESICQQNGVYLVSVYSRGGRTVLVKNVTRTACYLAVVNLGTISVSTIQEQAYIDNLLKRTAFLRYSAPATVTGKAGRSVISPTPGSRDTLPGQPQSQSEINPAVQQIVKPANDYNTKSNQAKTPTQTSTENLRVVSRKETNATLQAGINAYQRGQYTEAIVIYDRFLAGEPANAYALNLKGYSLFKLKRYEEAVTALLTATKADPGYAWAYFDLARVYCALGQSAAADEARLEAIRIQPTMRSIMQKDSEFMRLCGPEPSAK